MHHHTELSLVDEFRWVSPLQYLKNGWQNAVLLWCMLQVGPPFLHYYCAVVLHSCIVLPRVGHSSNHQYHCCQLKRQAGPPSLHYYCAVVLHSCIVLPPVGHSSNHQYHFCQLTRQSSCVSNFYRTFKVFIWLSLVRFTHVRKRYRPNRVKNGECESGNFHIDKRNGI